MRRTRVSFQESKFPVGHYRDLMPLALQLRLTVLLVRFSVMWISHYSGLFIESSVGKATKKAQVQSGPSCAPSLRSLPH